MKLAFTLWLGEDGTVEVANPSGVDGDVMVARQAGGLASGAKFSLDAASVSALVPGALADLLPDGLKVDMSGTKFSIAKAGKVKLTKDKSGIDESKLGDNPSGLKLTYKAKDASFKGSFSVYTLSGGKLKKTKVNVVGVVIGGVGYGTATIKKVGSIPVTIE